MTIQQNTAASPNTTQGDEENPKATTPTRTLTTTSRRFGRLAAIVLFVGTCGAAVWYWGFHEPEPKDDLGRFQGDWKQTAGGREEHEGGEKNPGVAIRITGDRWQYFSGGKERKVFRITLNESASPKEIDLTLLDSSGNPVGGYGSHGIYTVDRKSARVVLEPVNKSRPKDFDNPDAVVWVLTRVKFELPVENAR